MAYLASCGWRPYRHFWLGNIGEVYSWKIIAYPGSIIPFAVGLLDFALLASVERTFDYLTAIEINTRLNHQERSGDLTRACLKCSWV